MIFLYNALNMSGYQSGIFNCCFYGYNMYYEADLQYSSVIFRISVLNFIPPFLGSSIAMNTVADNTTIPITGNSKSSKYYLVGKFMIPISNFFSSICLFGCCCC